MLRVIVENKYEEQLNLTENGNYALLSVGGITPPPATINYVTLATADGAVFNSSRVGVRNIVITIAPVNGVESNRINLYKYFKIKNYIKLYFENNTRSVWIDGYIETIDGDLFSNSEQIQISIICPDPFFKDQKTDLYKFSNITNLFSFPFAIEETPGVPISEMSEHSTIAVVNNGDEEAGVTIRMYANGTVVNPKIYNTTTNENVSLDITMEEGDVISFDTRPGNKRVTLNRNGVLSNIINNMTFDSEWLTLRVGDNIFTYDADSGTELLDIMIILHPLYEGI